LLLPFKSDAGLWQGAPPGQLPPAPPHYMSRVGRFPPDKLAVTLALIRPALSCCVIEDANL